jgi:hypothetical protein
MSRLIAVVLVGLVIAGCQRAPQKRTFGTPHQAVLLDNGQLLFGKLADTGPVGYSTLTDVFYVQTQANRETGNVTSVLVRRGQESHKPDMMYISTRHIVLVESVASDSPIANLIAQNQPAK